MKDLDAMDSMEKMLVQKAYQRQAPVNGSLELLPLCNMNCDMCYVRLSKAEMEQKESFYLCFIFHILTL